MYLTAARIESENLKLTERLILTVKLSLIRRISSDFGGVELGLGELEVGELGHVGAGGAAVVLGDLVELLLEGALDLGGGVHQLAAGGLLLLGVLADLEIKVVKLDE